MVGASVIAAIPVLMWWQLIWMPSPLLPPQKPPRFDSELHRTLQRDVHHIAREIGERNLRHPEALDATADWIERELVAAGHAVSRQTFKVEGHACHNLEVVLRGQQSQDAYVIGAHYDSALRSPGGNDNGSGVAVLLALARDLRGRMFKHALRLVFFTNEEPPHFQGPNMGSVRHAQKLHVDGVHVLGMLSLETMGYFTDAPRSQHYPGAASFFYPDTGNFIAFVGDTSSRALTHRVIKTFRAQRVTRSEGTALPRSTPGIGWSDHWSYWQHGIPALMVTDTAPFRDPHYHTPRDTADHLDYERLARVTQGLIQTIAALADDDVD